MPVFFGTNLQILRKRSNITQEKLAQQMNVSRQTISKWESGEATPELSKLMELSDIFSCNLDSLLRENLSAQNSPVRLLRVKGFRMARYVMISANAESDVRAYMNNWAQCSGLLSVPGYIPKSIGWSFPYVSVEQEKRFGFQGYAAAYILPDNFEPALMGPEIVTQEDSNYAVITIAEPFGRNPRQIAHAIQTILEHLWEVGIQKSAKEGTVPFFELRYEKDNIPYVDIFLQCKDATAAGFFSF